VQLHKHATQQGYATQSEAEPETPNPHTGRETGLNNLSRGLGETAHRSPAGGTRRDVRARPTQGRARVYMIPVSVITCERTSTHTGMHPDTRLTHLTRQSIIDRS
jgi:hypothetical protein